MSSLCYRSSNKRSASARRNPPTTERRRRRRVNSPNSEGPAAAKAKDDDPLADLIGGDDSSSDAESIEQEETTAAHYAPGGQDIYGGPRTKWVPPSLRRRLNNDNTPTAVGDVLRGALNKVSDTNVDATSTPICGAYAKFPANDVHAFVSSHMRETCVHGAQNMEALVPPYAAVMAAATRRRPRARRARLGGVAAGSGGRGQAAGQRRGVIGGVLRRRVVWRRAHDVARRRLRDDGTAGAGQACAVVATGSRDVWRRSDLRGRLSKLAVRDESWRRRAVAASQKCGGPPAPRSPATSRGRRPCARRSRGRARRPRAATRRSRYPGAT